MLLPNLYIQSMVVTYELLVVVKNCHITGLIFTTAQCVHLQPLELSKVSLRQTGNALSPS